MKQKQKQNNKQGNQMLTITNNSQKAVNSS